MADLKYTKYILPNGIKCILYRRPEIHSIEVSTVVNVGSLDENSQNNGLSHLVEHLPFDGTEKFETWEKVDTFLNSISGSANAYTTLDHTKYYGTFPSQYLEGALEYISQLALHPLHKETDVNKEREIVLDEMKRYEDTIGHKVYRNIIENRFTDNNHSHSYDIIGTNENLKRFSRADVRNHFEQYYQPENLEIYLIGNFKVTEAKKLLKKFFYTELKNRKHQKPPVRSFMKNYPNYSEFKITADQKLDINQYYLTVTFPSYEFMQIPQEQRYKIAFASSMIASSQYQQSILWKRLREELGIVYGVSTDIEGLYNRAMLVIETSFNPENLEVVLKEIYEGVNKVKQGLSGEEVFDIRKKRVIDTELMRYDSPHNVLNWIVTQEDEYTVHKKALSIKDYLEFVKSLTYKDVLKEAANILDWSKANIGVVSQDDAKVVKEKVEKLWSKISK